MSSLVSWILLQLCTIGLFRKIYKLEVLDNLMDLYRVHFINISNQSTSKALKLTPHLSMVYHNDCMLMAHFCISQAFSLNALNLEHGLTRQGTLFRYIGKVIYNQELVIFVNLENSNTILVRLCSRTQWSISTQ